MSETNRFIVRGYAFASEAEAKQARKEAQGIRYIAERTDMDSPERVLQIYNKIIHEELFETVVGFSYLKELQEYLRSFPFIGKDEILPIPVHHPTIEAEIRGEQQADQGRNTRDGDDAARHVDYRLRYRITRMLCIVLAICVAAMFAITATTNSMTILNYEQQVIDKYEAWEQDLLEREAALREVERNGAD